MLEGRDRPETLNGLAAVEGLREKTVAADEELLKALALTKRRRKRGEVVVGEVEDAQGLEFSE